MAYKNRALQRETTRARVKRYRERQKGITFKPQALQNITKGVTQAIEGIKPKAVIPRPFSKEDQLKVPMSKKEFNKQAKRVKSSL